MRLHTADPGSSDCLWFRAVSSRCSGVDQRRQSALCGGPIALWTRGTDEEDLVRQKAERSGLYLGLSLKHRVSSSGQHSLGSFRFATVKWTTEL